MATNEIPYTAEQLTALFDERLTETDWSKGLTVREWAEKMGMSENAARPRLRNLVKAGKFVKDRSHRHYPNGTRNTDVYRPIGGMPEAEA